MNALYPVLLAAVIAFAGWAIKRALNRADEQRRVASRLHAYLLFWQKRALATGLWPIFHLGSQWYADDQAAKKVGGTKDAVGRRLLENEQKYQAQMEQKFKAEIAKHSDEPIALIAKTMLERFGNQREELRKEAIGQVLQTRRELMEGHAYVSDADLSVLDFSTLARAVELRLTLAGLLEQIVGIFQFVTLPDESMVKSMKEQIVIALLAGIRAAYAIKLLTATCEGYRHRGKLAAIRANLFA